MLAGASLLLVLRPSSEIYSVEVVVLAFAALYGFGVWPVVPTFASLAGFVALTGAVMVPRVADGRLPSPELVEVVVPAVLAGVVVYHVRRREEAVRRTNRLAAVERRRAAARERLSRMTSHEMRTPLTVAGGYVDSLLLGETVPGRRADLLTVREELAQLARVTDRLVRAVALDLGAPDQPTPVRPILDDVQRRWSVVVDRDLVVDCSVPSVPVNADRLRAALDTLVENAVRYTEDGDRIRLFAVDGDEGTAVGVADSGSGLSPALLAHVNAASDQSLDEEEAPEGPPGARAGDLLRDTYSQTGFGLRLVASVARTAGGRLRASRAPEGGALLAIVLGGTGRQRTTTDRETLRVSDPAVAVRPTS